MVAGSANAVMMEIMVVVVVVQLYIPTQVLGGDKSYIVTQDGG